MPTVIVRMEEGDHRLSFHPGPSLRDLLDTTEFRIRAGCRGMGACGLCRVRIEQGDVAGPTINERIYLDNAQLDRGVRLACQVTPDKDIQIEILERALKSNWKSLSFEETRLDVHYPISPRQEGSCQVTSPMGVAVDLGTTHINLSLCDIRTGQRLAGRRGLNPQMNDGFDVVNRLVAASESGEKALALSRQASGAIGEALLDMARREGVILEQVVRLVIVGNTPMLSLLTHKNYEQLLYPDYWMRPIDCLFEGTHDGSDVWGVHPRAKIEIVQPLAGFVGSDLLSGLLAAGLTKIPGSLFIDFGTNSEIALWDGQTLWTTSAAGGPAFEGCGTSCGMPAGPGAIYRAQFKNGSPDFSVIGNGKMLGLCGTGMVDFISHSVRMGQLNKKGQFAQDVSKKGLVVARQAPGIVLTKADVDIFQRAKAAIGAGVRIILEKSGMAGRDLQRVCVGGAFGGFLTVRNAQDIGLLPNIRPESVELCGNTALAGCENILLSPAASVDLELLREKARIINMSQSNDFEELFFENLFLEPMRLD